SRLLIDHDAEQLMYGVVWDLIGVPVFALDEDCFAAAPQPQIDAAIETARAPASAAVLDVVSLASVIVREQPFDFVPGLTSQGIFAAPPDLFQTHGASLYGPRMRAQASQRFAGSGSYRCASPAAGCVKGVADAACVGDARSAGA